MKKLAKGQLVVKVLRVAGVETATIERVAKVTKDGIATLVDSSLKFDAATRAEVDQAPGFGMLATCRLVDFDGGEEERWRLDEKGGA